MLPKHSQQIAETLNPVFRAKNICLDAGLLTSVTELNGAKCLRIYVDRNIPDHKQIIKAFCFINDWVIRHETPNLITVRVSK